jgi:hypothetical protein
LLNRTICLVRGFYFKKWITILNLYLYFNKQLLSVVWYCFLTSSSLFEYLKLWGSIILFLNFEIFDEFLESDILLLTCQLSLTDWTNKVMFLKFKLFGSKMLCCKSHKPNQTALVWFDLDWKITPHVTHPVATIYFQTKKSSLLKQKSQWRITRMKSYLVS